MNEPATGPEPPSPPATIAPYVRAAAAFLLLAGIAAVAIAARVMVQADGVLAVLTGMALTINGLALCLLGWSPALRGQPPRHWSVLIVAFAISVALEIGKRVL